MAAAAFDLTDLPASLHQLIVDGTTAYTLAADEDTPLPHRSLLDAWAWTSEQHLRDRMWYDGFCSVIRTVRGITYIRVRTIHSTTYLVYRTPPPLRY